jgi:hypothetical protein
VRNVPVSPDILMTAFVAAVVPVGYPERVNIGSVVSTFQEATVDEMEEIPT